MITDNELIEHFNYWLDHYTKNGERHYSDTQDWKIQELYYDLIVDRVLENYTEEEETDYIIERLSNLV